MEPIIISLYINSQNNSNFPLQRTALRERESKNYWYRILCIFLKFNSLPGPFEFCQLSYYSLLTHLLTNHLWARFSCYTLPERTAQVASVKQNNTTDTSFHLSHEYTLILNMPVFRNITFLWCLWSCKPKCLSWIIVKTPFSCLMFVKLRLLDWVPLNGCLSTLKLILVGQLSILTYCIVVGV